MNLSLATGPVEVNNLRDILNGILIAINNAAPGILNSQAGSVGNLADATDDTTFQYILAANQFAGFAVGSGIRVTSWGTSAANVQNKTFKIFFGATTAISSGVVTINAKGWIARATILRAGVSTQRICGEAVSDAAVIATNVVDGAIDETAAITVKVTNASPTSSSANDLLTKGFCVEALR